MRAPHHPSTAVDDRPGHVPVLTTVAGLVSVTAALWRLPAPRTPS